MAGEGVRRRLHVSHVNDVTLWTVVTFLVTFLHGTLAESLYFNSYGDCIQSQRGQTFGLDEDHYSLWATGGREMHETLICTMTFQAPPNTGVCLTFTDFEIRDCGVSLVLYQQSSASGKQWKKLSCDTGSPPQMCTPERYVTLKLAKTRLNKNNGYSFQIDVEKSGSAGNDVIVASSIGLFVGIIAGVVAIIVIMAVLVLCCCRKPCRTGQPDSPQPGCKTAHSALQPPVQPSAPPASEETTPLQSGGGPHLYPDLPHPPHPDTYTGPEEPPPYHPPPYEEHAPSNNQGQLATS